MQDSQLSFHFPQMLTKRQTLSKPIYDFRVSILETTRFDSELRLS